MVTIRVAAADGKDGMSILEHLLPYGDSPPLHIHRTQDEVFHVLEGEIRVKLGEQEKRFGRGDTFVAPKGVPHTYRVESKTGGRFLTVTLGDDFERLVRAFGRPAQRPGLPDPAGPPSPEAIQALSKSAALCGIDLVGPPLQ